MTVDHIDLQLIDLLQRDASQRLEDLARVVRLAPSSVHERIRRLERGGILQRWSVDVDPAALGLGVLAFVGIRAGRPCGDLETALEAIPAIVECHSVAGELSMLLKVRVAGTADLLDVIERLRQIPGIEGTETTIVLTTQFQRPLPVPALVAPRRRTGTA